MPNEIDPEGAPLIQEQIPTMRARDHTGLSPEIIHPSDSWAMTQNKTKQEVKN